MNVLDKIYARKREEVETASKQLPLDELKKQVEDAPSTRGFLKALIGAPGLALIAEVKKASPSKGLIRPNFDPAEVARTYEAAGAHCLSVLTDKDYFQGSPENLRIAKSVTSLPCLRKDFLYDEYQVYEARAWGADAILLIVAMLEPDRLKELHHQAVELGMDVLVEVHSEEELMVALAVGAKLIGVNNRNLKTFETSLETSKRLIPMIPPYAVAISESALHTPEDVVKVKEFGAKGVLIGTSFCSSPDIAAKVKEVMSW